MTSNTMATKKTLSEAASLMGRKGGRKGGKQAAANMTATERKQRASNAVNARWNRYREANPEAPPRAYIGNAAANLLRRLARTENDEQLVVEYDDSLRPTGRQNFNAAVQLVLAGKARQVSRVNTRTGEQITIAKP